MHFNLGTIYCGVTSWQHYISTLVFAATEGFEIPHPDFQFKSRRESNQLMLSKHPPPPPLALTIQAAHTPPLNSFSSLWPDGRDALHMYSNPSYFFEQWMSSVKKGALRRKSSGHILSVSVWGWIIKHVAVSVFTCFVYM